MRHLSNDLPVYTIQRRQWVNKLSAESQDHENRSLQMLGGLFLLGTLLTGILLLAWWTYVPTDRPAQQVVEAHESQNAADARLFLALPAWLHAGLSPQGAHGRQAQGGGHEDGEEGGG